MPQQRTANLKRSLTLIPALIFGLSFSGPLYALLTFGVGMDLTQGMLPTAYMITLIMMLFTANSYAKMAKNFPNVGSTYTYTKKAMSPHAGFLSGWILLLDYAIAPMFNSLLIGIYMSGAFPSVPSYIWIIIFIVINAGMNIIGIKFSSGVVNFLVIFQILIVFFFIVLSIRALVSGEGMGTLFSTLPFYNPDINFSSVFTVLPILVLSFIGFDVVTTLSEEIHNPTKTIPKVIFLVPVILGGISVSVSYFGYLIQPDMSTFTNLDSATLEIAYFIGGTLFESIFLAGVIISLIGSNVAAYASSSRVLYAMGRENVLPKRIFGYLSPKFGTPVFNVIIVASFSFGALFIDFNTAASLISFGVLVAFTAVNLAVIFYYFRKKQKRNFTGIITNTLFPLIGALFTLWLLSTMHIPALLLGIGWGAVGLIYLLYLTKGFKQAPPDFDETEQNNEVGHSAS